MRWFRSRRPPAAEEQVRSRVLRMPQDDPRLSDDQILAARQQWFAGYIERLETKSVHAEGAGPYRCPCCHHLTLDERGGYDICDVCFWEDDGQDDADADTARGGPNGGLSLTQARENYLRLGACEERAIPFVRPPTPEEL